MAHLDGSGAGPVADLGRRSDGDGEEVNQHAELEEPPLYPRALVLELPPVLPDLDEQLAREGYAHDRVRGEQQPVLVVRLLHVVVDDVDQVLHVLVLPHGDVDQGEDVQEEVRLVAVLEHGEDLIDDGLLSEDHLFEGRNEQGVLDEDVVAVHHTEDEELVF